MYINSCPASVHSRRYLAYRAEVVLSHALRLSGSVSAHALHINISLLFWRPGPNRRKMAAIATKKVRVFVAGTMKLFFLVTEQIGMKFEQKRQFGVLY